ncbi:hypothetical protein HKD37_20G055948 [Glycine soja]
MKLGKRELQTQFILVRPLLVLMSSPQATHLRFPLSLYSFTTSEPPRDTFPLCSEKLTNQETHCLLITTTVYF